MPTLDILRDNREQKPWSFDNFDATTRDVTLTTGDYTLPAFCDLDEEADTYYPTYAIERKAGQDFISSITRDRDRFKDEIKRAADWDSPLLVLIEEPKKMFKRQQGFMKYRDVSWASINGTVEKWERYYNVEFQFCGTRERCQQKTYDTLASKLRTTLVG